MLLNIKHGAYMMTSMYTKTSNTMIGLYCTNVDLVQFVSRHYSSILGQLMC